MLIPVIDPAPLLSNVIVCGEVPLAGLTVTLVAEVTKLPVLFCTTVIGTLNKYPVEPFMSHLSLFNCAALAFAVTVILPEMVSAVPVPEITTNKVHAVPAGYGAVPAQLIVGAKAGLLF